MSAFRSIAARRSPLASFQAAQRAAFSQSSAVRVSKEDRLNTDISGEEVDAKKREHVQKQKEGKGHWEEELASNSESIIKADRGEVDASDATIKKLQEETKKASQKK